MGSAACLRIFSGILQAIFTICGLGMIIYGAYFGYMICISNGHTIIQHDVTPVPCGIACLLGIILLLLVVMGCCGVCRESICCMETYSAFLIILSIAHIALGAYCVITYNNEERIATLSSKLEYEFDIMVEQYPSHRYKNKVDQTQYWFECCGSKDFRSEYRNLTTVDLGESGFYYPTLQNDLPHYPSSCCKNSVPCTSDSYDLYKEPCAKQVAYVTIGANDILGWCCLAIGAAELIASLMGITLSCCIWRNMAETWR